MAQTGYTPILIYSSSTVSQAPSAGNLTNSTLGSELAINITDGKLFYKDNANAVQVIAWKTTPTTAGGTGLTSYTAGAMLYYASGTALTNLAIGATGRWLGSSGTAPQWNAPAALTKTDDTNVTLTLGGSASTALLNAASLTLGWTGQLAVTRGGTGLSTVAQGDILYGSASNTLAALAKNTSATRYLSNTGTSNNPAWAQVDLTNGVTGTLPVGNGGTGATTFTAGRVLFGNTTSAINTSANLFWDNTNSRLGIRNGSPDSTLVLGNANTNGSNAIPNLKAFAFDSDSFLEVNNEGNNSILMRITRSDTTEVFNFNGHSGNLTIFGAISKGSGSFRIDHPLPKKEKTHYLVHSFVEAPRADNIYRGKIKLNDGQAVVNIDAVSNMTEGTFVLLNREVQCFTSNESDWDAVRGFVSGNILTIECENAKSMATISWMVIGERQDKHMMETDWTDDNGRIIVEPEKVSQ